MASFRVPDGLTCEAYAGDFVRQVGRGYLTTLSAGSETVCGYCQYATGTEYLATLNIVPGQKWRDLGIFIAFVISNWALVYFFIYTVRVRGWTFGIGWVFGRVERDVKWMVGSLKRTVKKREESNV